MNAEDVKRHEARAGDAMAAEFERRLAPHTARFAADLVDLLHPQAADSALDIAGGSGAAGLKLAERVGPQGAVCIVDLSPAMLRLAAVKASERRLANVQTRVMDAEMLEFPDNSFDLITCSFGVMFFPDVKRALEQTYRVLKPGGRIGFTVWSAPERFPFFFLPSAALLSRLAPAPLRAAVRLPLIGPRILRRVLTLKRGAGFSPARFGAAGSLERHLAEAGFGAIRRELRAFPLNFDRFHDFWETFTRATPMAVAVGKLPARVLEEVKQELRATMLDPRSGAVQLVNEAALVMAEKM
jgi:ubiquinone/menaquinone biosynthesis C-methylase UbiE